MTNKKLDKALRRSDKRKEDKVITLSGELGIPLNGQKVVEVPNRKGFVFVRIKGNTSELIQAYNNVVSPIYDLPVLVVRSVGAYKVVGRNVDRYQNVWGGAPYLPKHGAQHSFNQELNIGGDIVWVYSQQFMPLLSYPSGTVGSMRLSVQPHFYEWNGQWKYSQTTGTPDYTPYVPTITGSARMVLSYIDPSDNSIRLVPGTPFANSITGSAQIAQYIPDIPREVGIPLSAVRLTTGTTTIGWGAIYDVRDFYTVGKPSGSPGGAGGGGLGFVGQDEGIFLATGTVLNVTGAGATLTASGTVFNLDIPGGGAGGAGVMAWDEGVPLATGTIFNFTGAGVTATASGTVINVDVPSGRTLISSANPSGTATVTFNSIPGTYKTLEIELYMRGTQAANLIAMSCYFNNDTTATNYRRTSHEMYGGTTQSVTGADDAFIAFPVANSAPSNSMSVVYIKIIGYAQTTFNKMALSTDAGRYDSSSLHTIHHMVGMEWENTAAITRIDLTLNLGNYAYGSEVLLYGSM